MGRASRQAGPLARRALIACLATPTAALDTLWQAPAARAELKVADSAEAKPTERRDTHAAATTTLRCSGSDPLDRACLAHDLYYDTQTRTFLFYGSAIVRDVDEDAAPADAENFRQATCAPEYVGCTGLRCVHMPAGVEKHPWPPLAAAALFAMLSRACRVPELSASPKASAL